MFPYARLVNTIHMQLAKPDAKRLAIGLHINGAASEATVVPRVMHALERLHERQTSLQQTLTKSFWLPYFDGADDLKRIHQEAQSYGFPVHNYGAPMPPQANHLQVAPRGLLSCLNESQGFDVAFVPARPQAIKLAQAHVPVTVVVSDMYDDLAKMTDTIIACPVLLGLTRYPGNKFLGWDELFDAPEPIPGLMDAVDKWTQKALDEGRPQARMLSNDLTAVYERALVNSTTLEEFQQAIESVGAYPVRGMLIDAFIDRLQGTPRGTTETVAIS